MPATRPIRTATAILSASVLIGWAVRPAQADETRHSPYVASMIKGQEDYVHVWTAGVQGVGDEADKLVTVDVNPTSKTYGKVVHSLTVGGRGEANHLGFGDDRKHLWAGRLDDSKMFVFDVGSNPARPRIVKTIIDLPKKTGYVGPRAFCAVPGRMLVQSLSNSKDHGGMTGIAVYSNKGDFLAKYDMPLEVLGTKGDGFGYDLAISPAKTVLLSSSFGGRNLYMANPDRLLKESDATRKFGNTLIVWELKSMRPVRILNVPGSPMEIRWSPRVSDGWAIAASALTAALSLVRQDAQGLWQAREVARIGGPGTSPLPADMSITADGKGLWLGTFMDGMVRYFDLSDPEHPKQVYAKRVGSQVGTVAQSVDGKRIYVSSSLFSNWDKRGADDQQFLALYHWDGSELKEQWRIDFYREKLGRAGHMQFSARPARVATPGFGEPPPASPSRPTPE